MSVARFVKEVKQETKKITWPSRKETMVTTMMVLLFVAITAVFFFVVDQVTAVSIRYLLGLGG